MDNDTVIAKAQTEKLTGIAKTLEAHLHAVNGKMANIISRLTRGNREWLTPERAAALTKRLDETQALINTVRSMVGGRPSVPPAPPSAG